MLYPIYSDLPQPLDQGKSMPTTKQVCILNVDQTLVRRATTKPFYDTRSAKLMRNNDDSHILRCSKCVRANRFHTNPMMSLKQTCEDWQTSLWFRKGCRTMGFTHFGCILHLFRVTTMISKTNTFNLQ